MALDMVLRWPPTAHLLIPRSVRSFSELAGRPSAAVRDRQGQRCRRSASIRCVEGSGAVSLRTCKNCKKQFDPATNHPRACRFHTAHFGGESQLPFSLAPIYFLFERFQITRKKKGETRRKFESVYEGGTMNTPNSGKVLQYWHCCGSEDPLDTGCTAAPHYSYDD